MSATPHILRIADATGRDLLVVRLSADGQAGEVAIDTPSVRMVVRVPEILPALLVVKDVAHVEIAPPPWARVEIV